MRPWWEGRILAAEPLLYAWPLSRVVWLTLNDLTRDEEAALLRLGELPSPVIESRAEFLVRWIDSRDNMNTAANDAERSPDAWVLADLFFQGGMRLLTKERARNSLRERASCRRVPRRVAVRVLEPVARTPRKAMQVCSGSMTMPTPLGFSCVCSQCATSLVSLGASQAALEAWDLVEPAFRLGFGDSGGQVVADAGKRSQGELV